MIKLALGFLANLFTSDRAADTAIDIVRNVTGANDVTDEKQLQFVLDYINATKHQSQTRRFLAVAVMIGIMLFSFIWLICKLIIATYVFVTTDATTLASVAASQNVAEIATKPLNQLSNDIYLYMKDVLKEPFMLVLGFYFLKIITDIRRKTD